MNVFELVFSNLPKIVVGSMLGLLILGILGGIFARWDYVIHEVRGVKRWFR
jgi:hypothetical protein